MQLRLLACVAVLTAAIVPVGTASAQAGAAESARRAAELGSPVSQRVFRDCEDCPEMVVVPAGTFLMGSPADEAGRKENEGPQRTVTISRPFAVGRFEVTWSEWEACVRGGGCDASGPASAGGGEGWGKRRRPAINVDWNDAQSYVRWLSGKTGATYRLLTEAEWEYAARAGTTTAYWWGPTASREYANYGSTYLFSSGGASGRDRWKNKTAPVGEFLANAFGLHDMHGYVTEWTEDCYADSYAGAPTHEHAVTNSSCAYRVDRGGNWIDAPEGLRSAERGVSPPEHRSQLLGFRLARTL